MEHIGYDRKARLLNVLYILISHPHGIRACELASRCGVHVRTTYRDLDALQEHMDVKLWQDRAAGLWGIVEGTYLPPVAFSRPEAMAIFLAARLLLAQHRVYNPHIATTFRKLSAVVDAPLRDEVRKTLDWMEKRKTNPRLVDTLNTLTECWLQRRQARIRYWTLGRAAPIERVIEPYFIHPSVLSNATYIIAYCHLRRHILVFRLDRVEDVTCLEERYEVPDDFDANVYLSPYFDITATGEPQVVKLRFNEQVARIARETAWHDSQITEPQTDGSAIVTMNVAITTDLVSFVLGWSDMVEVLRPASLRRRVARVARRVAALYGEAPGVSSTTGSPAGVKSSVPPAGALHAGRTAGRQLELFGTDPRARI